MNRPGQAIHNSLAFTLIELQRGSGEHLLRSEVLAQVLHYDERQSCSPCLVAEELCDPLELL